MRVLLISANTERMNILPLPLGLAMVAAASRRAGHEVTLLNLMFEEDTEAAIGKRIGDFRPQVIGISVRNVDDQNMESPQFLLPPARQVRTRTSRFPRLSPQTGRRSRSPIRRDRVRRHRRRPRPIESRARERSAARRHSAAGPRCSEPRGAAWRETARSHQSSHRRSRPDRARAQER